MPWVKRLSPEGLLFTKNSFISLMYLSLILVSTSKSASNESLSFFNTFVEVDDVVVCFILCINNCCSPTSCFKRFTSDKKVYITVSVVLSIVNFLIKLLIHALKELQLLKRYI